MPPLTQMTIVIMLGQTFCSTFLFLLRYKVCCVQGYDVYRFRRGYNVSKSIEKSMHTGCSYKEIRFGLSKINLFQAFTNLHYKLTLQYRREEGEGDNTPSTYQGHQGDMAVDL